MKSVYDHEMSLSRTSFPGLFSVPVLRELQLRWRSGVEVVFGEVCRARESFLYGEGLFYLALFYRHHVTDYALDSLQM